MPRNVRNFWIEIEVDGRKHKIAAGPKSKDGGFRAVIKVRDNGQVKTGLVLTGVVDVPRPHERPAYPIRLSVTDETGRLLHTTNAAR